MYQGKNPAALASQKLLLDALNALLEEKDFKDISVLELCRRSGVSRQTFYTLFGSKENILLYQLNLINDTVSEHEEETGSAMELMEMCQRFGRYVTSNYAQLTMLIDNHLTGILHTMMYQSMASCRQSFVALDEETREYAAQFTAAGLCSLA